MREVFVSYAHRDNRHDSVITHEATAAIDHFLAVYRHVCDVPADGSSGDPFFVDRSPIQPGEPVPESVRLAISTCSVMLAFYSPRYFASHQCLEEWKEFKRAQVSDRADRPPRLLISVEVRPVLRENLRLIDALSPEWIAELTGTTVLTPGVRSEILLDKDTTRLAHELQMLNEVIQGHVLLRRTSSREPQSAFNTLPTSTAAEPAGSEPASTSTLGRSGELAVDQIRRADGSRRVFLSYADKNMHHRATALRDSLRRHGVRVVGDKPRFGENLRKYYAEAIFGAQVMIMLLRSGDVSRPWLQFETQMMLQTCWKNSNSRIAVVAPAIGAIPKALRHQDFVRYFPHDEVNLRQWGDHAVVDSFVERLLNDSATRVPVSVPDPMSDEEVRDWRNRLVHIGSSSPFDNIEDRERLTTQLRSELNSNRDDGLGLGDDQSSDEVERLIDRALLASALGNSDLVAAYYRRLQDIRANTPQQVTVPRPRSKYDEDYSYRHGLVAFEAKDYHRAQALFTASVEQYSERHGQGHPTTIAALYNLALTRSQMGDSSVAAENYKDALARSRSSLGDHHPQTAAIANHLAILIERSGDIRGAQELLELAADAYRAVRPADSPELASVLRRIDALGLVENE